MMGIASLCVGIVTLAFWFAAHVGDAIRRLNNLPSIF
jgi:hypothetical protein